MSEQLLTRFTTLGECHRFKVTSNPGEQMLHALQFTDDEIRNLPPHTTILDIGSGTFQENASSISTINAKVRVCSLDPTLAMYQCGEELRASGISFSAEALRAENLQGGLIYERAETNHLRSSFLLRQGNLMHKLRMRGAHTHGGVAAFIDRLPFCRDSFSLIIETFGPWTIFCDQQADQRFYLGEIYRVLRPDGEARIFPAESALIYGNNWERKDDRYRHDRTRAQLDGILKDSGFDASYFEHEVTSYEPNLKRDLTNLRLGVILRKTC